MNLELDPRNNSAEPETALPSVRLKSAQRLKYDAEVRSLIKKVGNLEDIRGQLALSKRKMAQLLLVDPSAWSRWTKEKEDAPPVIYRALQWYLALNDKYPSLDVGFWLQTVARPDIEKESSLRIGALEAEVELLRQQIESPLNRNAQWDRSVLHWRKWVIAIAALMLAIGIAIGRTV